MINYKLKTTNENGDKKEKLEVCVNFGLGTVAIFEPTVDFIDIVNAKKGIVGTKYNDYKGTDKTVKLKFESVSSLDSFINDLFKLRKVMVKSE